MKVAVIGYYGRNFGDLLMLDVFRALASDAGLDLVVFTYGHIEHIESYLEAVDRDRVRVFGLSAGRPSDDFDREISSADALVWGGGTCFMDQGGTGGVKYFLKAYAKKVPTYYFGVGVDRCNSMKTKICLGVAALISRGIYARDVDSANVFKRYVPFWSKEKVKLVPDLAFGGDGYTSEVGEERSRYLVLCLRDIKDYFDDHLSLNEQLLAKFIDLARLTGVSDVDVLVGDADVDEIVSLSCCETLQSAGLRARLIDGSDVSNSIKVIAGAVYVVSVRLHPAVVAHLCGVPYSIFNYSDKNRKFAYELGEGQRVIEVDGIGRHEFNLAIPDSKLSSKLGSNLHEVFDELVRDLRR